MIGANVPTLTLGLALVAGAAALPASDPPADGKEFAVWVESRVQAWQPTTAERSFDQIGWVPTIVEAERLAKQHDRPLFLFTFDGPSMSLGRC